MNRLSEQANKLVKTLDNFILFIGHATSWLTIILVAVIILQVVLRYVFGKGLVILEELQWHLYGVGIMIGLSYCLTTDSHIRLDVLSQKLPTRKREIIEILGTIFLLMPMIIIILIHSWDMVATSWQISERSDAPMGLPCRWIIKSFIPIGFILMGISAVSSIIRSLIIFRQAESEEHHGNK